MPPSKDDRRRFLSTVALFAELGADEVDRIAAQAAPITLAKGATLFRAGDLPRGFYVVMEGRIKVSFLSARGDEKVLDVFEPGRSFGEAVAFLSRPCPVSAQAMARTVVLLIPVEAVLDEIHRDGRYAARVIAGLCRRIHALVMDLEAHAMHSGTQRVAAYLLAEGARAEELQAAGRSAPHAASAADGAQAPLKVRLATSKGLVASRLSLTQEHFSRILGELSRQGVIAVRGRDIQVLNAQRLRESAA